MRQVRFLSAAVQTDPNGGTIQTKQSTGQQTTERVSPYETLKLPEQNAPGTSTAWEPFVNTDGSPAGSIHEEAALLEQNFLAGLMDDTDSGIARGERQIEAEKVPQKPLTAHERLALQGKELLDMGDMSDNDGTG